MSYAVWNSSNRESSCKLVINYEELKAALSVELEKYKGLVVHGKPNHRSQINKGET